MSNLFFPWTNTRTHSDIQIKCARSPRKLKLTPLTWSSASSSSRSSPVAIGMTSSTLVGAGLSPAHQQATDQNKPLGESRK